MKRILSLSLLLCVAVALAVTTVQADTKTFEMRYNRMPMPPGTVDIDGVTYDTAGYVNGHMITWETEEGGVRSLLELTGMMYLYYEGQVVGRGVSHMLTGAQSIQDGQTITTMVTTLRGSGWVVSYHYVIIVRDGQVVALHEIGTQTPP